MVAIQWDLPFLCKKISRNAQAGSLNGFSGSLQAACYSHIAFNLRDDSLCRKLPAASNLLQKQQGDFLEGCMKHVTFLRSPSAQLWGRYGPEQFPTRAQFQEAMQELGYPATTDWLHVPRPTPQEYENYLWGTSLAGTSVGHKMTSCDLHPGHNTMKAFLQPKQSRSQNCG